MTRATSTALQSLAHLLAHARELLDDGREIHRALGAEPRALTAFDAAMVALHRAEVEARDAARAGERAA